MPWLSDIELHVHVHCGRISGGRRMMVFLNLGTLVDWGEDRLKSYLDNQCFFSKQKIHSERRPAGATSAPGGRSGRSTGGTGSERAQSEERPKPPAPRAEGASPGQLGLATFMNVCTHACLLKQ